MASTTPRYSFPYQEATDPPAGNLVGQDLAEAVEDSLGDLEDALEAADTALDGRLDTVEAAIPNLRRQAADTSIGTAATGFSVSSQVARVALDGKLIYINIFLARTGADITQTNTNIADTACFTLDSAYWPTETVPCIYGNGSMDGEAQITSAGVINLRSASFTLTTGTNIRLSATYIVA